MARIYIVVYLAVIAVAKLQVRRLSGQPLRGTGSVGNQLIIISRNHRAREFRIISELSLVIL
ncbi:MAG: hypothetical protein LC633_09285, partial [Desulfobulbaceae bacterium]|nr:hypothetical protein [Desulfobulbaceae bacterium]